MKMFIKNKKTKKFKNYTTNTHKYRHIPTNNPNSPNAQTNIEIRRHTLWFQIEDADREWEYRAWAKGRVQSERETQREIESERETKSESESETKREIKSVWKSESEMIVRLREWEGDWESESDERVRLSGREGDLES